MSAKDRLNALEKRSGGPDMSRKILMQSGDSFIEKGTDKRYTAQEAADLDARGLATLIVFHVVYGPEKAEHYDDE